MKRHALTAASQWRPLLPLIFFACISWPCLGAAATPSPTAKTRAKGIRLIGAGLSCTGTQSLVVALKMLGYTPVHGMYFWLNTTMRNSWRQYTLEGGSVDHAVDTLLDEGYDVTLDVPTVYGWKALVEKYPDSKVILTVRDSPETWYRSYATKMVVPSPFVEACMRYVGWYYNLNYEDFWLFLRQMQLKIGCDFTRSQTPEMREKCIDGYRGHMEEVKRVVPAENLLVFNLKEGWAPLCRFLGVDVPVGVPFPKRDITKGVTSDVFTDMMDPKLSMNFRPFLWFVPFELAVLWAIVKYCCCRCCCCCRKNGKDVLGDKKRA